MATDRKRSAVDLDPERTVSDSPEDTTPPDEETMRIQDSVVRESAATDEDQTFRELLPEQTEETLLGDASALSMAQDDTIVEGQSPSMPGTSTDTSRTMMDASSGESTTDDDDEASAATVILSDEASPVPDTSDATMAEGPEQALGASQTLPTDSSAGGGGDSLEEGPTVVGYTGAAAGRTGDTALDKDAARSKPEETAAVTGAGSAPRGAGTASGTAVDYIPAEEMRKGEYPGLGRFEILKLLGQGAFGSVYLAHDPHLDRKVAIKVAKTGVLVGKNDVDRFMREARSAAQLRHPNIVPVYEVGQLPNTNFIAYEYVEGRTLGDLIKERKKLSCDEATAYMRKIASGLHYAHEHGIVHRDMKPENILLDASNEPHIADFGLARRDEGDTQRTREGMFMGTPSYMSPEQASGKAHLADARSDVWSLGVMLQEMLTGVRPFRGNVTAVLIAVQNHEPPSVRTLDKSIPKDLETIVEKCLIKDTGQRYQSAQMLADELERWQRGEPILARPIGVVARTWRWLKRNPSESRLLGAIAATIILAALVVGWFGFQAVRSEKRAYAAAVERAESQLLSVRTADAASLPVLFDALQVYGDELHDQLMGLATDDELTDIQQSRVRLAATTLYPQDPRHPRLLKQAAIDLLQVPPTELIVRTTVLSDFRKELESPLWNVVTDGTQPQPVRFQALAALASLRSDRPDWSAMTTDMVAEMLSMDPLELSDWLPVVRPIRDELEPALTESFTTGTDPNEQYRAAMVLGRLFRDTPETLVALVPKAEPNQMGPLLEALKPQADLYAERLTQQLGRVLPADGQLPSDRQAELAAKYALALIGLERGEPAWPLLKQSPNETLRTALIHSIAPADVPWKNIATRLEWEQDPGIIAALCMTLGEYGGGDLLPGDREGLAPMLLELFQTHPHPGVHSAAEWVLSKWEFDEDLNAAIAELKSRDRDPALGWHIDPQGYTFTVITPERFLMGSPTDELQFDSEVQHLRFIPRTYGIATREVTVAEYLEFDPDFNVRNIRPYAPTDDCPIIRVKWYDAIAYCRWLSEKEGFEEREIGYQSRDELDDIRRNPFGATSLKLRDDLLDLPGYRLPTSAEWEYAARAGTVTIRPIGTSQQYLNEYAWFLENGKQHAWPGGLLKPNSFGLFDIQGNVSNWCQNYFFDTPPPAGPEGIVVDGPDGRDGVYRDVRGGSFRFPFDELRVARNEGLSPNYIDIDIGIRLARTYPHPEEVPEQSAP